MTEAYNHQVRFAVSTRVRRMIGQVLIVSIGLLVLLGSLGEVARLAFGFDTLLGFIRLFGLGQEANVPTWFSSATLLIAALLAAVIAFVRYQYHDALALQWWLLSLLLGLMSLDETALIHETSAVVVAQLLLGVKDQPWYVFYAWIPPGIVIGCAIVWWFSTLWRSLGAEVQAGFTRAAALYFGGVLGMEVAEAAFAGAFGIEQADNSPIYTALWTTQELLEMAGVAALILALLDYLSVSHISIAMQVQPTTESAGKTRAQSETLRQVDGFATADLSASSLAENASP